MCKGCVKSCYDCTICLSIGPIYELMLIMISRDGSLDVRENQSLETLGDDGG